MKSCGGCVENGEMMCVFIKIYFFIYALLLPLSVEGIWKQIFSQFCHLSFYCLSDFYKLNSYFFLL